MFLHWLLVKPWILIAGEIGSMLVQTDSSKSNEPTFITSCICNVSPYYPFFCFIAYEATSLASFKVAFFYNGGNTIFFTLCKLSNFCKELFTLNVDVL